MPHPADLRCWVWLRRSSGLEWPFFSLEVSRLIEGIAADPIERERVGKSLLISFWGCIFSGVGFYAITLLGKQPVLWFVMTAAQILLALEYRSRIRILDQAVVCAVE